MKCTAIVINFLREPYLRKCLDSLQALYPQINVKVGENGHYTDEKKKWIESVKERKYYDLPFDSGVCVGRNRLMKKVRTKYVLVGDDDFMYTNDSKVDKMIEFLEANPEYDLVGGRIHQNGRIHNYQGFFEFNDKNLNIKAFNTDGASYKKCEKSGLRYANCDLVFNFFVARTKAIKEVLWDEKIKVAYEHSSFFIAFKEAGKKVAFSPDPIVIHKPKIAEQINMQEYSKYRRRKTDKKRFFEKHNIVTLTDMQGHKDHSPVFEKKELEENKGFGDITFIIKTLKRRDSLEKLLFSIVEYYPHARILIGDDDSGFDVEYYKGLWERLFDAGLKTKPTAHNIKPDAGLSFSRNYLVEHCYTDYILLLDDDFVFTEDTKIERFVEVLEDDPTIGVVGGKLIQGKSELKFAGHFDLSGDTLTYKKLDSEERKTKNASYYTCDFVLNFALFRRELFNDVRWDDELKIAGEHTDFYLKLRDYAWKAAYTPDVTALHEPTGDRDYKALRSRTEFTVKMFKKWGIKRAIYEADRYQIKLGDNNEIINSRI